MTDGPVRRPPRPRLELQSDTMPTTQRSGYVPTTRDLSEQIAAISAQVNGVLRETVLTRRELGELRTFVMGDMAPRVSGIEQKTGVIPSNVKKAGKVSALLLAVPVILQVISELKPNMAGPLQSLIQLFQ